MASAMVRAWSGATVASAITQPYPGNVSLKSAPVKGL
jgi:hypothetical protein